MRLRLLALVPLLLLATLLVPQAGAASRVQGIDVSKYQHSTGKLIDWAAVKRSGQTFAFIKATGGSNRIDPWFVREWAAAGKAGMIRGAYHYADPSRSADAQAALIVDVVGSTRERNNLGIVLDLESTGGLNPTQLRAWAHTFMDGVERRTGRLPILYTYVHFWKTAMANDTSFGKHPLWLARYSGTAPAPLPGWNRWTFWQHTSSHRVPGIPGNVDHNYLCCAAGTLTALADGRSRPITDLWRKLGGASGRLGLPLGPETAIPGGWGQTFEKGYVASTKAYGTRSVTGVLWSRYKANGGASSVLGVPTQDATSPVAGVTMQAFVGGRIVHSAATGAHAVTGPTAARWLKDGGIASQAGLPTTERIGVSQQFKGGGLYLTRNKVRMVPGAIRDRYEELGGASSSLGLPTTEAQPMPQGRLVQFDLGQIMEIEVLGQRVVI